MYVRVATGNQLPKGWSPGMPLTVGRRVTPSVEQPQACPFGPECYSCHNGLRWDAALGKHQDAHEAERRLPARRGPRPKPSPQRWARQG